MVEMPFYERDRLRKGGRANRDRNRRDDEQEHEIGREAEQRVADRRSGESQEQRRDACSPVDPSSKPGGECYSSERSRRQDSAEQQWA